MRPYLFSAVLAVLPFLAYCQSSIVVEKVALIETVENKSKSEIPRVKDLSNDNNAAVSKINAYILDRFMIESFNQKDLEQFNWYGVRFDSEVRENILLIRFEGEYLGAYLNEISEEMFFDIRTGDALVNHDIPFQSLFSLHGYLDFMNRYWLTEARQAFKEAVACAEFEPYCSYYDIYRYHIEGNSLSIALSDDCYPRVARACSPAISQSIPLDSLKLYLSDAGKKILLDDLYTSKTGIEKYLYNLKAKRSVPNNMFLFGTINQKYAFSMAVNLPATDSGDVSGYYYYDNKLQKLTLKGKKVGDEINLTEFVAGKTTGSFKFGFESEYNSDAFTLYDEHDNSKYLTGIWTNAEKTKTYQVQLSEVKVNVKD